MVQWIHSNYKEQSMTLQPSPGLYISKLTVKVDFKNWYYNFSSPITGHQFGNLHLYTFEELPKYWMLIQGEKKNQKLP